MESAEGKRSSSSSISGKLVIIGIVVVALWAAGISWWFRYNATHRAAKLWGADSAVLVRDAPEVTLHVMPYDPSDPQTSSRKSDIDVSQARGLTYLRNALLEDHNFTWPNSNSERLNANDFHDWKWILEFRDPKNDKTVSMQFTKACTHAAPLIWVPTKRIGIEKLTAIPTDPLMAKGLREMFAEFTAASSADAGAKPPAANEPAEPKR
jgi:hypothetical protein